MKNSEKQVPDFIQTMKKLDCQIGGGGDPQPELRKDFPGQSKYIITIFRQLITQLEAGTTDSEDVKIVVNWLNNIMQEDSKSGTSIGGWRTVLDSQITSIVQTKDPKTPLVRGYKTWAFLCMNTYLPDLCTKLESLLSDKDLGSIDYYTRESNAIISEALNRAKEISNSFSMPKAIEMTSGVIIQNFKDAKLPHEDFGVDVLFLWTHDKSAIDVKKIEDSITN